MFARRLDPPVNNMCFYFATTEMRSDLCVFSYIFIKKLPVRV